MSDKIYHNSRENEIVESKEYYSNVDELFASVPEIGRPLLNNAKITLSKIEKSLYSVPAFVNAIKASIPEEYIQAVLTDEQKSKIAKGALKLMTKKDGTLMANLVNTDTNRVVSTVSLKKINVTPDITQAMTKFANQMQMAQIAEQINIIQIAVEEVRQGQEYDRLATAYSCQQKLLQALLIKDASLKSTALLMIASDAEDSRNLLMQSQIANVTFIKNQPESFWGKMKSGASIEKVNLRMHEIRESLCAVNMVSFVEAMAYLEMGENDASRLSLKYYVEHIQKTYLQTKGLVERLDLIDPSPQNYWSTTIPEIKAKINGLPYFEEEKTIGDGENGN